MVKKERNDKFPAKYCGVFCLDDAKIKRCTHTHTHSLFLSSSVFISAVCRAVYSCVFHSKPMNKIRRHFLRVDTYVCDEKAGERERYLNAKPIFDLKQENRNKNNTNENIKKIYKTKKKKKKEEKKNGSIVQDTRRPMCFYHLNADNPFFCHKYIRIWQETREPIIRTRKKRFEATLFHSGNRPTEEEAIGWDDVQHSAVCALRSFRFSFIICVRCFFVRILVVRFVLVVWTRVCMCICVTGCVCSPLLCVCFFIHRRVYL